MNFASGDSLHKRVIAATPDAFHVFDVASQRLSRVLPSGPPLLDFTKACVEVISGRKVEELVPRRDLRC